MNSNRGIDWRKVELKSQQIYQCMIRSVVASDSQGFLRYKNKIKDKVRKVLQGWEDNERIKYHRQQLPKLIAILTEKYAELIDQHNLQYNEITLSAINDLKLLFIHYKCKCKVQLPRNVPELRRKNVENIADINRAFEAFANRQFNQHHPRQISHSQTVFMGRLVHENFEHQFMAISLNQDQDNVLDCEQTKKILCAALNHKKDVALISGVNQNFQVVGTRLSLEQSQNFSQKFLSYVQASFNFKIQPSKIFKIKVIPILERENKKSTRKYLISIMVKYIKPSQPIHYFYLQQRTQKMCILENRTILQLSGQDIYKHTMKPEKKNKRKASMESENEEAQEQAQEEQNFIDFSEIREGQLANHLPMDGEYRYFSSIMLIRRKRNIQIMKLQNRITDSMRQEDNNFLIKKICYHKFSKEVWGEEKIYQKSFYFMVIMHNIPHRLVNNILTKDVYDISVFGPVRAIIQLTFNSEEEMNEYKKDDRSFVREYTLNFEVQTLKRVYSSNEDLVVVYIQINPQKLEQEKIFPAALNASIILATFCNYPKFIQKIPDYQECQDLPFPYQSK